MPTIRMSPAHVVIQRIPVPASGQIDYFDDAYPGLAVRVTAKGVKAWTYLGRVNGKVKRVTLGRHPQMTLRQARRAADDVKEDMSKGVDPIAAKRAARLVTESSQFDNVLADWLKRDQADNRSHAEVKRLIERDVLPAWQGWPIANITRQHVLSRIDAVVDRGAPVVARRLHAHLHRLFQWSVERGIIATNPMLGMKKPGKEKKRERVLSGAELAAVWRATEKTGWPFGLIVRLLILTGARREEIGGLQWEEIVGNEIKLSGARTKVGKEHTIPLSTAALDVIATLPRIGNSAYVFTTTGETPVSGWGRAKELLDKAVVEFNDGRALPDWRIHDLRRTFGTGLEKLGIALQVTEAILGHVSGSRSGIVGVYQQHKYIKEKRVALEVWGRLIELVTDRDRYAAHQAFVIDDRAEDEFKAAIIEGGERWSKYLEKIMSGAPSNVVPLLSV